MILHEDKYRAFLAERTENDVGSINSHCSYLRSVSRGLGNVDISPELFSRDIEDILDEVRKTPLWKREKLPAEKSIDNWRVALSYYREMCKEHDLFPKQAES